MFKRKIGIGAGVIVSAAVALTLSTVPAWASGSACGGVGCAAHETVDGSGLYIDYISSYIEQFSGGTWNNIHYELYGPRGELWTSPTFNLPSGYLYEGNTQYYDADMPAGDYCIRVYQGSSQSGNAGCVDVHS